MADLYRANVWFEYEIMAWPGFKPSKKIAAIQSWLESIFFALSGPEDLLLLEYPLPDALAAYWKSNGLRTGSPLYEKTVPGNYTLKEWGRTSMIENNWVVYNEALVAQSRKINSKITQTGWKTEFTDNKCHAVTAVDQNELRQYIAKNNYPVVLKNEFSHAGREFRILHSDEDLQNLKPHNKPFVIERWMQRTEDFSLLFDVRRDSLRFLSMTAMEVSAKGQFSSIALKPVDAAILQQATTLLQNILSRNEYEGPLSLDGFNYIDNGTRQTWIFSEINFRFSMGRILFDLMEKFGTSPAELKMVQIEPETDYSNFQTGLLLTPLRDSSNKPYRKALVFSGISGKAHPDNW